MLWFLLLLLVPKVYAQNYFDFAGKSLFLSSENRMEIKMEYDLDGLKEEDFKMRILSSDGISRILVDDSSYVSNNLWLAQPNLIDEFEIKIQGKYIKTEVWFEILDEKSHKRYTTPKHVFVNHSIFKDYLNKLNESLAKW